MLSELRAAFTRGDSDVADRIRAAVEARRGEHGEHLEWGVLCEAAGLESLAVSELQLALRDSPGDVAALSRLTVLHEERGDIDAAIDCAARWLEASPADGAPLERLVELLLATDARDAASEAVTRAEVAGAPGPACAALRQRLRAAARETDADEADDVLPGAPTDGEVTRFLHAFAGRENVYARQWWNESGDGGYSPVREPFTFQAARNHLLGSHTAGVYVVRLDNTVTFCAFDVDITRRALSAARGSSTELRRLRDLAAAHALSLAGRLRELGLAPLLEDSGYKGRHLWLLLAQPEDAAVARQLGGLFLARHPCSARELHVEFFPKQASVDQGVGNLIKLPLGIHRRTGRRSRLLLEDGRPDPDPHGTLRELPRASREALHAAITGLKALLGPLGTPAPLQPPGKEPATEAEVAALAAPAPPAAPPAWTAADFETHREIGHLFGRCPVLAALKQKVEDHRRLSNDEQIVLAHSIGHSGPGVLAVNYLLDACVDVPPGARLQSPLAGNPISCGKIRKRIPHVTGAVACHCDFGFASERYPTPRLHLLTLPAVPTPAPAPARDDPPADPVERARALGVLWARRATLLSEIEALETELTHLLRARPDGGLDTGDGTLRLVEDASGRRLVFEPRS